MTTATALAAIFWVGVGGTLYAYGIFPVIALILAAATRARALAPAAAPRRMVTIIIPAYNEERNIAARIHNVLSTEYPRALLDVIVVSDASTDGTDELVRSFQAEGVRLLRQERRLGKTAGLNGAMKIARGDIVVFTDANAAYPRDTIAVFARSFDDATIGLVTGYTRYTRGGDGNVAEATNVYTALERIIKRAESAWGCCVGADGAVFAMRQSLYRPLREDDINDFVLPLSVIESGYRCVLSEDAFCSEEPGKDLESEFRRQSRITNRTLRALWRHARLLNPFRFPAFSFFLFSHKIVRFMVPFFVIASMISLAVLAPSGGMYMSAAVAASLVAALAGLSRMQSVSNQTFGFLGAFRFVHVFVTINAAILHGWWKFLLGRTEVTWQHDRSPA